MKKHCGESKKKCLNGGGRKVMYKDMEEFVFDWIADLRSMSKSSCFKKDDHGILQKPSERSKFFVGFQGQQRLASEIHEMKRAVSSTQDHYLPLYNSRLCAQDCELYLSSAPASEASQICQGEYLCYGRECLLV